MTVWYLPIEPYKERYTAQLRDWTVSRFKARDVQFLEVPGQDTGKAKTIGLGVALDAHGRTLWGLSQTASLITELLAHTVQPDDVIYMQDLYQPGFDALLYVFGQQFPDKAHRPRIFTHNLAQTIDPDDFTHGWPWMRSFERMVDSTAAGVFYASTEHKRLADIAGFTAPAHVVGLLHDRDGVRALGMYRNSKPLHERSKRMVYTSRFDREKNPHFFLDLAEKLHEAEPNYKIAILTGAMSLRSNDSTAVRRAMGLCDKDVIDSHTGLSKAQYYDLLGNSRLQINTASQDWVSNTLLESSALGTPTLAPAYKGFPEALFNNERCLFVPWSLDDAFRKARALLALPPPPGQIALPSLYHNGTLDRVIDIMLPEGKGPAAS